MFDDVGEILIARGATQYVDDIIDDENDDEAFILGNAHQYDDDEDELTLDIMGQLYIIDL